MKILKKYHEASGQEINIEKSCYITHSSLNPRTTKRLKKWIGYKHSNFPFNYLGCPIYTGRKRIDIFTDLTTKVINKTGGWKTNLLSAGGKALIIKHVVQSQTLHLFAALEPPITTLKQIEMYFCNFFWGQKEDKNKYHWSNWKKLYYPTEEKGLGFKRLKDICKTFTMKRWWRLRTMDNLWSQFIKAKYCPRANMVSKVISPNNSNIWRSLLKIRPQAEHNIQWEINKGNTLF
ncbi:uncharacterized protein LOC132613136 [Lycium barbarum]|uniref:uncharacterized protein LOC132613136 n=1 Tax=Lycium barbarum TaxID=112863 RepID=UPI00293E7010|nr:uncharacterized protein LOC132613136 [Lycium barbarum]